MSKPARAREPEPLVSEDQVREALPAVETVALRLAAKNLPRGINADDLISVGNEAILEASRKWDGSRGPWIPFVKLVAQQRMKTAIARARKQGNRLTGIDLETDDGSSRPRADPKATEPGDQAAARETFRVGKSGKGTSTLAKLKDQLPDPSAVAAKVTQLRAAMFEGVQVEDVKKVMNKLVTMASGGNLKAIESFLQLLGSGPPGIKIVQNFEQNVAVIQSGDVD